MHLTINSLMLQITIENVQKQIKTYFLQKYHSFHLPTACFIAMLDSGEKNVCFMPIKLPPKLDTQLNPVPASQPVISRLSPQNKPVPFVFRKDNKLVYSLSAEHQNYKNLKFFVKPTYKAQNFDNLKSFVTMFPSLFSPTLLDDWEHGKTQMSSNDTASKKM